MADLKNSWKETGGSFKDTGKSIGHAFRDLGKSMVNTVATGAEKASNWARKNDDAPAEEAKEATVTAPAEEVSTSVNAIDAEIIED